MPLNTADLSVHEGAEDLRGNAGRVTAEVRGQSDEEPEEEEEEEAARSPGPSCFPHAHIQSSFSFCTSLGASTKSSPLNRMRPPVTTLAEPQNNT
ncbi:hypothetical protein EYF80_028627 [Liparis tanakae]|uniref:Uncharacterized protein n=1 Tax=Liparis tanakae TaxID=230148 RepID=A0A4Z2H5P3_9TELE|nr:hypothetical protein EYF80_028627 [Liparis tanakae]